MGNDNYLYRKHSRRSRDEMASFLMTASQRIYLGILISLLGGTGLHLERMAEGEKLFSNVSTEGMIVIYVLAIALLWVSLWGAKRLRNYALKIWDDLENESST